MVAGGGVMCEYNQSAKGMLPEKCAGYGDDGLLSRSSIVGDLRGRLHYLLHVKTAMGIIYVEA